MWHILTVALSPEKHYNDMFNPETGKSTVHDDKFTILPFHKVVYSWPLINEILIHSNVLRVAKRVYRTTI